MLRNSIALLIAGTTIALTIAPVLANSSRVRLSTFPTDARAQNPSSFAPPATAERMHREFDRYTSQPCEEFAKVREGVRYALCAVQEPGGVAWFLSASENLVEFGDGIVYWFTPDNELYAVRLTHSGETYLFDKGSLQGELMDSNRVKISFTQEERDRVTSLLQDAIPQLDKIGQIVFQ